MERTCLVCPNNVQHDIYHPNQFYCSKQCRWKGNYGLVVIQHQKRYFQSPIVQAIDLGILKKYPSGSDEKMRFISKNSPYFNSKRHNRKHRKSGLTNSFMKNYVCRKKIEQQVRVHYDKAMARLIISGSKRNKR